jgi:integrase
MKTTTTTTAKPTTTTTTTATTTNSRSVGRPIDEADRTRLVATMNAWAESGSFLALRTRAFVLLAWGSGLLVSEVIALNVRDVLDLRACTSRRRFKVAQVGWFPTEHSAIKFTITPAARAALKAYISFGVRAGLLTYHSGALFVRAPRTLELVDGGRPRARISVRAAQRMWSELQSTAQLTQHYRTDDLRFDAIARFAARARGDVHRIRAFARFADVRTATRYVPDAS